MIRQPFAALALIMSMFAAAIGGCSSTESDPAPRSAGAGEPKADGRVTKTGSSKRLECGTRKGKEALKMKIAGMENRHSQQGTWIEANSEVLDEVLFDVAGLEAFAKQHLEVTDGWHDPRQSPLAARDAWSRVMGERLLAAREHVKAAEWVEGEAGALDSAAAVLELATDVDELRLVVDDLQLWCLPTTKGTYKTPIDLDFDRNRCSEVYGAELVRVLASTQGTSAADTWWLVDAGYAVGWVTDPRWTPPLSAEEVEGFVDTKDAVVASTDVYRPFGEEHPFRLIRLGTRLPRATIERAAQKPGPAPEVTATGGAKPAALDAEDSPTWGIRIPTPSGIETIAVTSEIIREQTFVNSPPAFTRRNVLETALRRLGDPYGWGGTRGGRDCSRLVLDLLRFFGLRVGRNSSVQAKYGSELIDVTSQAPDEKRRTIRAAATRGVVLLYMPGHIMLYLGEDGGEDYVLSSISEYVTPCSSTEDYINRIDRVAVTPLSVGADSIRRSFAERITSVQVFGTPAGK